MTLSHPLTPRPPRVFFSYSKTDVDYLKEFKNRLSTLKNKGEISFWDDSMIRPGEDWDDSIKTALAESDIIFLLVSTDFLATDYLWNEELAEAIRRHNAGTARVIPRPNSDKRVELSAQSPRFPNFFEIQVGTTTAPKTMYP